MQRRWELEFVSILRVAFASINASIISLKCCEETDIEHIRAIIRHIRAHIALTYLYLKYFVLRNEDWVPSGSITRIAIACVLFVGIEINAHVVCGTLTSLKMSKMLTMLAIRHSFASNIPLFKHVCVECNKFLIT